MKTPGKTKDRNRKISDIVFYALFILLLSSVFGLITASASGAVAMLLTLSGILFITFRRAREVEWEKEKRREEITQILRDFAQDLPGPPIKLIHTPKEVVEQRTEELVEKTTEEILKLS